MVPIEVGEGLGKSRDGLSPMLNYTNFSSGFSMFHIDLGPSWHLTVHFICSMNSGNLSEYITVVLGSPVDMAILRMKINVQGLYGMNSVSHNRWLDYSETTRYN